MGILECCVGGCTATSETNRLFSFPMNDYLRNLWMSFLVPTNPLLIGLSKGQLLKKRVCDKHFDKQQFDGEGRRLRYSYPCLFSELEIAHGEPLTTKEWNVLNEHNYFQEQSEDNIPETSLTIEKAGDRGGHGHCPSTPVLDKKASGTVDLNIENLNSVDTALNSPVSHEVDIIESDLAVPQIIETAFDSEVPDTAGPFTWQKQSEVIVSDDEDDELRQRSEIVTDNVLYENNKNVTKRTSEFNITREDELELQCDGNEEDDQLHRQHYKCNMCSSLINGFRYRCVQCADYDLCAACETRGAHERHYMLRIPGPRPYAEVENVLNRIRRELLDNNTVLFKDTDMLDSLKHEVKDELEDPLHENQTTENSDHTIAADNLNEVHDDDPLESDTDMQSTAEEEDRRLMEGRENDNIAYGNDNMTLQDGKEDRIRISRSVLTEPNLKVIVIGSLKRKINESPTKFSYISNIQQPVHSKKIMTFSACRKKLANNVSSIQPHLHSNEISLLPVSTKQSGIQQQTSFVPVSTKQLPDNFHARPKKSAIAMKIPQKSIASNPSNVTNNSSTPLFVRQPLNVITETNQHLLAEQLFGDKVPQVHLEKLRTQEIKFARKFS